MLVVSVPNIGIIQFISNRIRHSTLVGVMWKGAGVESTPRRPLSRHKPWLFASVLRYSLFCRAPNSLTHSNILKTNRLFWPICFQDIIDTQPLDCPAFPLMPRQAGHFCRWAKAAGEESPSGMLLPAAGAAVAAGLASTGSVAHQPHPLLQPIPFAPTSCSVFALRPHESF